MKTSATILAQDLIAKEENLKNAKDRVVSALAQNDNNMLTSRLEDLKKAEKEYKTVAELKHCSDILEKNGKEHFFEELIKDPGFIAKYAKPTKSEGSSRIVGYTIEEKVLPVNFSAVISGTEFPNDADPTALIGALSKCICIRKEAELQSDGKISDESLSAINLQFKMKTWADRLSITSERTISNKKIAETMQKILDILVGETDYKVNSHDVRYILDVYTSYNKKNPGKVLCMKPEIFTDALVRGVFGTIIRGEKYGTEYVQFRDEKVAKIKEQIAAAEAKKESAPKTEKKSAPKTEKKSKSKAA